MTSQVAQREDGLWGIQRRENGPIYGQFETQAEAQTALYESKMADAGMGSGE